MEEVSYAAENQLAATSGDLLTWPNKRRLMGALGSVMTDGKHLVRPTGIGRRSWLVGRAETEEQPDVRGGPGGTEPDGVEASDVRPGGA